MSFEHEVLLYDLIIHELGEVHKLIDLNQVDRCVEGDPLHLSSCRFEFLPRLLRPWPLGKCQTFAQTNGCIEGGILT